jgi:hypothetical protein
MAKARSRMTTSEPMTWWPIHRLEACDATQSVEHRGRAFEFRACQPIRLPALRTGKTSAPATPASWHRLPPLVEICLRVVAEVRYARVRLLEKQHDWQPVVYSVSCPMGVSRWGCSFNARCNFQSVWKDCLERW